MMKTEFTQLSQQSSDENLVPRKMDIFWGIFFLLVWLLPLSYTGFTNKLVPLIPKWVGEHYRISSVFARRVEVWPTYVIRFTGIESGQAYELPVSQTSRMLVAGYYNRVERAIEESYYYKSWRDEIRESLAQYWKRWRPEAGENLRLDLIQRLHQPDPKAARRGDRLAETRVVHERVIFTREL